MNPLGAFSLEAKAIAAGVLILALLGSLAWFVHHERQIGAAAVTAAVQHAADVATAANAAESARRQATQQENLHEADRFNAARAVDAAGLDAVVRRLHNDAASGRLAAADPAAAGSSQAAGLPAAGMVPADVYLRAVDAAADLAKAVDCLRGVSELCAGDYDALTKSPIGSAP